MRQYLFIFVSILFLFEADALADETTRLAPIEIHGRTGRLEGIAESVTQGSTSGKELSFRAVARPGDVMETVPGLIITQHDGGGKANQYFLRGFNLDHGTDLATSVDGVPLNMPSHVHGQGYTDTNWLIPELISSVDFEKGPFDAEYGDFSNAGHVDIHQLNKMPVNTLTAEGGTLGYARALVAASHEIASGQLLYALEVSTYDGAWDVPDEYQKLNGAIRYSRGEDVGKLGNGYSVSAQGYSGKWIGSEQVPQRAISSSLIGRYGSLDSSDGGVTHRWSVNAEGHRQSEDSATQYQIYYVNYGLDLYSNFTYFLDQTNGDQIEQREKRSVVGGEVQHKFFGAVVATPSDTSVGFQLRQDRVEAVLNKSVKRAILSQTRSDTVAQSNAALWVANKTSVNHWFRSVVGGRLDTFWFNDQTSSQADSGSLQSSAFSPKASLVFGPFFNTEFYLSGAEGLRSTDARTLFQTTATADGPAKTLPAVIRSRGAEIGVRQTSIGGLQTTLAFWELETDSETYFSADSGSVEDSGRSGRRIGIDWTNAYEMNNWILADADFTVSKSRYISASETDPGDHIPEAVRSSLTAGLTVHDGPLCAGCFVTLRTRFFGARDLNSTGSEESAPSTVYNLAGGYPINKTFIIRAEILNLTDAKYNDAEYYATSRLSGEAAGSDQGGTDDHMVHAGEPRSGRLSVVAQF